MVQGFSTFISVFLRIYRCALYATSIKKNASSKHVFLYCARFVSLDWGMLELEKMKSLCKMVMQ